MHIDDYKNRKKISAVHFFFLGLKLANFQSDSVSKKITPQKDKNHHSYAGISIHQLFLFSVMKKILLNGLNSQDQVHLTSEL